MTASMGFLKENPELFVPALPLRNREAISSMGFGDVAKAFLLWEGGDARSSASTLGKCLPRCVGPSPADAWQRRVLGCGVEGMVPLWMEDVRPQLRSAKYTEPMSNGRQWYEDVCMYTLTCGHPLCIDAWVGGEAAILMETLPESEVKDVLHELLALFLDEPELPPPCRLVRTQWYSNPYTRGAYSYLVTGVPLGLHQVLRHPLPSHQEPVLQLAGEACSKDYYSTMHGALQSGRDAASIILRHHNLTQS